MKIDSDSILAGFLTLLLAAGIALAFFLDRKEAGRRCCTAIEIDLGSGFHFISEEDASGLIREGYGDCIGHTLDSLALHRVESLLDGHGAVLKSQVWMTPDGVMHVSLTQRTPVARFLSGDNGFYVDRTGFIFPLQRNYTAQVPVIDGNLPIKISDGHIGEAVSENGRRWVERMIGLVEYMDKTVWAANISQISVLRNGDLIMVPREGKETIIFGEPSDYEMKFGRIEKYYTHILPEKGEGYYKHVNVKYKGQIICTQ